MHIPYITLRDYFAVIQQDQLNNQLLDPVTDGLINSNRDRVFAENWALGQIRSKIGDIYDLDREFTPTKPYVFGKSYTGGERVTIDFPDWTPNRYDLNSLVIKDGFGWICLAEPSDATWDEGQWMSIGYQYDIYYVNYPYPVFQYFYAVDKYEQVSGIYNVGDIVFWNGKIYSSKYTTSIPSREDLLNRQNYESLDKVNHFPSAQGTAYWNYISDYSVTDYPTSDSDIWTLGDNRDAQIVQCVIDLSLFQLHKRISSRNIPQMRIDSMKDQMNMLSNISSEIETIELPTLPAKRDSNISWGSKPRHINGW